MPWRICPECDKPSEGEVCPWCGTRTLFDSAAEPSSDPLLGKVFDGRYRLESLLGRGGMGAVYKAVQIAMNKVVAVKVVRPEYAENMEAARRFHREAKAASTLSHPHTIRVFDFGQAQSRELYMVMEFLEGRALGKVLREEGRLAVARAVKIGAAVASSLVEAHAHGLVHRDMKPDNVVLVDHITNDPDFVKVLDFGIAKFLIGSSGDSTVTRTGAVIGTPTYMAPEQAKAERHLTTAVDVYSLGVLLFQMLSGDVPFRAETPVEMLMAHLNEPVPDLPANLTIPEGLRSLVHRMLAKAPTSRPSAEEVAHTLEDLRLRELARTYLASASEEGRAEAPRLTTARRDAAQVRANDRPSRQPAGPGSSSADPGGVNGMPESSRNRSWWFVGIGLGAIALATGLFVVGGVVGSGSGDSVIAKRALATMAPDKIGRPDTDVVKEVQDQAATRRPDVIDPPELLTAPSTGPEVGSTAKPDAEPATPLNATEAREVEPDTPVRPAKARPVSKPKASGKRSQQKKVTAQKPTSIPAVW